MKPFFEFANPVSYTHLDVYKRQLEARVFQQPRIAVTLAAYFKLVQMGIHPAHRRLNMLVQFVERAV